MSKILVKFLISLFVFFLLLFACKFDLWWSIPIFIGFVIGYTILGIKEESAQKNGKLGGLMIQVFLFSIFIAIALGILLIAANSGEGWGGAVSALVTLGLLLVLIGVLISEIVFFIEISNRIIKK